MIRILIIAILAFAAVWWFAAAWQERQFQHEIVVRLFDGAPDPGLEGKPITLSALVRNTGTVDTSDVVVAFYDGDPAHGGVQILNRELTTDLLAARNAIVKNGDASLGPVLAPGAGAAEDRTQESG